MVGTSNSAHSSVRPSCSGLVILLFDTLRRDFRDFAANLLPSPVLPAFNRLAGITTEFTSALCGSFPTLPMRTDFLTGKPAFLGSRWARPLPNEPTLTGVLESIGVHSTLVTDNYVIIVPQLAGCLGGFFNEVHFVRGSGADPWQDVRSVSVSPVRITRSIDLERQCVANMNSWSTCGGPPAGRLFAKAEECLFRLIGAGEPFVLLVDCFSVHEPWLSRDQLLHEPRAIVLPPYGNAGQYASDQLASLRMQYALRLKEVDALMASFSEVLARLHVSNDTALLVMSDHGFLFGEYGLVGKPKGSPVLPDLHKLVLWGSHHFEFGMIKGVLQPHELPSRICELFGMSVHPFEKHLEGFSRLRCIGRNSPDVDHLLLFDEETSVFYVLSRDSLATPPRRSKFADLVNNWEAQASLDSTFATRMPGKLAWRDSAWLGEFSLSLSCGGE